jgi:hypothetical protein
LTTAQGALAAARAEVESLEAERRRNGYRQ